MAISVVKLVKEGRRAWKGSEARCGVVPLMYACTMIRSLPPSTTNYLLGAGNGTLTHGVITLNELGHTECAAKSRCIYCLITNGEMETTREHPYTFRVSTPSRPPASTCMNLKSVIFLLKNDKRYKKDVNRK